MTYKASVRISAPDVPLVTTQQAQRWLHRDDDDDIEDISLLIEAAMSHLDGVAGILRRALIIQQWSDIWSGFPGRDHLALALVPAAVIESVKYYDAQNTLQTMDPGSYSLHRDFVGSYLRLTLGQVWPSAYERDDAVTVTYTAGYGAAPSDVPAEIRLAARELIEGWYNCDGGRINSLPAGIMTKLRRFIRPHF